MFNQLLQNLAFSPSLISQIGFYSKRLKQEEAVRKLGFVMLAIAFFMQTIAFLTPPEASIATNNTAQGFWKCWDWNGDGVFTARWWTGSLHSNAYESPGPYCNGPAISGSVVAACNGENKIRYTITSNPANLAYRVIIQNPAISSSSNTGPNGKFTADITSNRFTSPVKVEGQLYNSHTQKYQSVGTVNVPACKVIRNTEVQLKKYVKNPANGQWVDAQNSAAAPTYLLGQTIEWRIEVKNLSDTAATQVVVQDQLDSKLRVVGSSLFPWNVGTLAAKGSNGDSKSIEFKTTSAAVGTITNQGQITNIKETGDSADNNTDPAVVKIVNPTVNVSLKKYVSDNNDSWLDAGTTASKPSNMPEYKVGDEVKWRIVVIAPASNQANATGVKVEDQPDAGIDITADQLNHQIGTMEPGSIKTIYITSKITEAGVLKNNAVVTLNETTDAKSDNVDPAYIKTSPKKYEVELDKQVETAEGVFTPADAIDNGDVPTYRAGSEVKYKITVTADQDNDGAATNINVKDNLPASLNVAGASSGNYNTGARAWQIDSLKPGESESIIITTKIVSAGNISNTAQITDFDQINFDNTANNTNPANIKSVLPPPDVELSLRKQVRLRNSSDWVEADQSDGADVPTFLKDDVIKWRLVISNLSNYDATGVKVTDTLPAGVAIKDSSDLKNNVWSVGDLDANKSKTLEFTTTAKAVGTHKNSATITAIDQPGDDPSNNANPAHVVVKDVCAYNKDIAKDSTDCKPCPVNKSIWYKDDKCQSVTCDLLQVVAHEERGNYQLKGTASAHKAEIKKYVYVVTNEAGDEVEKLEIESNEQLNTASLNLTEDGTYTIELTIESSLGDKTSQDCMRKIYVDVLGECIYSGHPDLSDEDPECKPCEYFPDSHYLSKQCKNPYTINKTVSNVTKNIKNADGKTADAGDTIVYTLTTKNLSPTKDITVSVYDDLSDSLDYAKVVDFSEGGVKGERAAGVIGWDEVVVPAGKSVQHTITMKIHSQIPENAQGTQTETSARYDLNLNNVYGNDVNVKLKPSFAKRVEGVATNIPDTGPGVTMTVAALSVAISAFFWARTRQLRSELETIRKQGEY